MVFLDRHMALVLVHVVKDRISPAKWFLTNGVLEIPAGHRLVGETIHYLIQVSS